MSDAKIEVMLWSDPPDEPSEELREAQAKLRRLGFVLATAVMVGTLVLLVR
ncbi:hypothetical protein GR130_34545 [Streptomyces sp. GS7]|nr:hypothetical protein [Streptomyces sp. GS7]QHC25745.1 hypothetical protein GR130_34545 [Streptomyces sp. GS7]